MVGLGVSPEYEAFKKAAVKVLSTGKKVEAVRSLPPSAPGKGPKLIAAQTAFVQAVVESASPTQRFLDSEY